MLGSSAAVRSEISRIELQSLNDKDGETVAAMALFMEMMVISFAVLYPSWSWGRRGMEYALFMGLIALSIFMQGGGRYSVDQYLPKQV